MDVLFVYYEVKSIIDDFCVQYAELEPAIRDFIERRSFWASKATSCVYKVEVRKDKHDRLNLTRIQVYHD